MGTKLRVTGDFHLTVNVFDGSRQLAPGNLRVLFTVLDGSQVRLYRDYQKGPSVNFKLPFHNNFQDNYTVVGFADGYTQAGFTPVKPAAGLPGQLDLMLLREDAEYNFNPARWAALQQSHPGLAALLAAGAESDAAAQDRYTQLLESHPDSLAALFNITTAMAAIQLPSGTPMDYLKELIWDGTMASDRFYAWADAALIDQVVRAAAQGLFAPETGAAVFHAGATRSYKQIQFGEANVQITFHEDETRVIGGVPCVKVEPDIDYYKDLAAHALLEVLPNAVSGGMTDPKQVYVLRWIAGRHAGVPEFDPPYTLV